MSIPVTRLNHAVLYVADVERSVAFYRDVLGMEVVTQVPGAAFVRAAAGGGNHHDLGLFQRDRAAGSGRDSALYHLAWEVARLEDLVAARDLLAERGSLVGASDHGVSKSLYAVDPDGNELEVMWAVPRAQWGELEHQAVTRPLDLDAELARDRARAGG